jgi:uracil phosphoribosyltransferase
MPFLQKISCQICNDCFPVVLTAPISSFRVPDRCYDRPKMALSRRSRPSRTDKGKSVAGPEPSGVIVVEHPLIATKLTCLRDQKTAPAEFRRCVHELTLLLLFEAARRWEAVPRNVKTPLAPAMGAALRRPVVLAPILRAGLGMCDGILQLLPEASVAHLGIYRDKKTLRPVTYFCRLPSGLAEAEVLLLDPMLATGVSACEAIAILKRAGAARLQFLCLVSCEAGLAQVQGTHPDVPIVTAVIDPKLDRHAYIVPGLGDAGDRYFGTG